MPTPQYITQSLTEAEIVDYLFDKTTPDLPDLDVEIHEPITDTEVEEAALARGELIEDEDESDFYSDLGEFEEEDSDEARGNPPGTEELRQLLVEIISGAL